MSFHFFLKKKQNKNLGFAVTRFICLMGYRNNGNNCPLNQQNEHKLVHAH
jgi:hypothetical protein